MKDKFWIAFSSIEQIDSPFIQRLYGYFGDIEKAFNASLYELKQIDGLSVRKVETFYAIAIRSILIELSLRLKLEG